jgi:hypothetical protein
LRPGAASPVLVAFRDPFRKKVFRNDPLQINKNDVEIVSRHDCLDALLRIQPCLLAIDRVLTWMLTVRLPSGVVAIKSMFGVFFNVSTAIQPRLESSAAAKYSMRSV